MFLLFTYLTTPFFLCEDIDVSSIQLFNKTIFLCEDIDVSCIHLFNKTILLCEDIDVSFIHFSSFSKISGFCLRYGETFKMVALRYTSRLARNTLPVSSLLV